MRREYLAVLLMVLLFSMVVGIVLTLEHLYQIPERIINEVEKENNITTSSGRFERFHSYDELTGYIKSVSPESWVQPIRFSLTTTMATTTAVELNVKSGERPEYYSNTNVQVTGIDEADIVKTDGEYVYLISSDTVKIVRVYPPKEAGLVATIYVKEKEIQRGLLIHNTTLILFTNARSFPRILLGTPTTTTSSFKAPEAERPFTRVILYDISNREKPVELGSHNITGFYVTARMVNDTVVVVTQESLFPIYREYSGSVKGEYIVPVVDEEPVPPDNIFYVKGSPPTMYVTVAGINLANGVLNASSVLCPPLSRVYVSHTSIYLLSTEWLWNRFIIDSDKMISIVKKYLDPDTNALIDKILSTTSISKELKQQLVYSIISEQVRKLNSTEYKHLEEDVITEASKNIGDYIGPVTHVYRVSLERLSPTAHQVIEGSVLDQFAIDEAGGYFRIVTTADVISGIDTYDFYPFVYPLTKTVNNLYILNSTSLKTIGLLEKISPGERVYSARYVGDTLYLVTYRRIDPLFAIDLSDPTSPRILGYAEFPGYSEYLHPINNSLLIGIGYMTDNMSRITGIKVSLYSVVDPLRIAEKSSLVLPFRGYSEVMYEYHAFTYNPREGYIAFPVNYYDSVKKMVRGVAEIIGLDNGKLYRKMEIEHSGIRRILYVETNIITVSEKELKITTPENITLSVTLG
jgi:inhibitor of cysteine peptidase